MKAAIRNAVHFLIALSFATLCAAHATAHGQGRDMRVVSARAGGVNYVFGDVKYRARGKTEWQTLDTSRDLDSGDVVKTGSTGLAEVLLNPGSYLRLGTNSEFELSASSLDELRVKLVRGSAVIEATGYDGHGLDIKVDTPQTEVSIVRSGIYRFNVLPANVTEVVVQKGRALVGKNEAAALVLKGGSVARVAGGGTTEVAKFDKKNRDELDVWSKERGEDLAEANRKLTRSQANTLLASMGRRDVISAQYSYSGVWAFNARRGCYTFVPFSYGWRSPYGGWYDNMLSGGWGCNSCSGYGQRRPVVAFTGGGSSGMPGTSAGAGSSPGPSVNPGTVSRPASIPNTPSSNSTGSRFKRDPNDIP